MKIVGWRVTVLTSEFSCLGWVVEKIPTEFGASPTRDKAAREDYIRELLAQGKTFTVEPIIKGDE